MQIDGTRFERVEGPEQIRDSATIVQRRLFEGGPLVAYFAKAPESETGHWWVGPADAQAEAELFAPADQPRAPMGLQNVGDGSPEAVAIVAVEEAVEGLVEVPNKTRELALAVTNAQQALMWATRDLMIKYGGLEPYAPRVKPPSGVDGSL